MKRTLFMAATAMALVFSVTASLAQRDDGPPPGSDQNGVYNQQDPAGYYNQNDRDGYLSRDGRYNRYSDRRDELRRQQDMSYREGNYEDNCRSGGSTGGTIFGALAGGLIGSAASHGNGGAVVGGAILGGMLGNAVSRDMPCEDHPYAMRVYSQGLDGEIGQRYSWRHGNDNGYLVSNREFNRDGYVCREFSERTYARSRNYSRNGTACRQHDGYWHFD